MTSGAESKPWCTIARVVGAGRFSSAKSAASKPAQPLEDGRTENRRTSSFAASVDANADHLSTIAVTQVSNG